ncbi:hypothetical protein [Paludisphaera mucosa]|uniref:Uncharacterized protein n=1 Tax=Paludisphaera mucosa TaxID=3030827 RepID=A0ABT6FHY8_9BACT|nr:hypothetical protein [Paludisphaera mucosa]MDG3007176.1 hypothetical protein [Paludisphaera mucosa]
MKTIAGEDQLVGRKHRDVSAPIGWDRARAICGDPRPPGAVTERQFDGYDHVLKRLARTPHERMDLGDLGYYYHDLAYVELQLDLLEYLLPACLMDWRDSLMKNRSAGDGGVELHFGLLRGDVLERLVAADRREAVYAFFRDAFLERLDAERGFVAAGMRTPAYGWMGRFNSVGLIMPRIDLLWEPWWSLETPGRAVAALQYCSGLMYFEGENPLFSRWTPERGEGGPYLTESDSLIHDVGWKPENVEFLSRTLTVEFVEVRVAQAVARLEGEPDGEKARRLLDDLPASRDLIASRAAELPLLLAKPARLAGWSV